MSKTEVAARETQRMLATQAHYRSTHTPTDDLIAIAQHGNVNERMDAVKTLAMRNEPRAAEAVISALKDPDGNVQVAASQWLEKMGDAAVEPVIAALADPETASSAAGALGKFQDPRAVEPLIAMLEDEESSSRDSAAAALGDLRDPRAIEPLIAFLQNPVAWNRQIAADALGKIGDPRVIEPLLAALNVETDQNACHAIAEALGGFNNPRAIEPLLNTVRENRCYLDRRFLVAYGEAAVQPLIAALEDENWQLQDAAVDILIQIGDPAVEPMMAIFDAQKYEVIATAYPFYIALGREGTETGLVTTLEQFGDAGMATTFLNSGNQTLSAAAKEWASAHGYIITFGGPQMGSSWGNLGK